MHQFLANNDDTFSFRTDKNRNSQTPTPLCLAGPKWASTEMSPVQLDTIGCVACDVANGEMEVPAGQSYGMETSQPSSETDP